MTAQIRPEAVPSYVAALHALEWDAAVAGLAARMEAHAPGGRFVVLADETGGRMDVAPHEKVAHGLDLTGIGLPFEPPGQATLAFSRDHALYVLLHALPRHDYYVVCGGDVQVNTDLDALVGAVAARGLDLVAPLLRRSDPSWMWHGSAAVRFAEPWAMLFAVVVLSRRALELLYAARLADVAGRRQGGTAPWVFCEAFVPSVIAAAPGMRMADLAEFVRLPRFSWDALCEVGAPGLDEPGTMAHPVLGRDRLIARRLGQMPPEDYLNPDSFLRQVLAPYAFDEVLPHLRLALAREGNAHGLARLRALLRGGAEEEREVVRAAADLARGKPCAEGPMGGEPGAAGEEAWWQVDLGGPHAVHEVEVLDGATEDAREGLVAFFLRGSLDGERWSLLQFRPFGYPVSADAGQPERIALADRPVARFVRLQLPGAGTLRLGRVRIWGDPVAEADAPPG